jgi:hypothetical protein
MSTSALSGTSLYQRLEQYFRTRSDDLQQLGQALVQGNLAGAQASTSQPQVTLNLNGNTNEEVVLNLLGNTSSTNNAPANGNLNISA